MSYYYYITAKEFYPQFVFLGGSVTYPSAVVTEVLAAHPGKRIFYRDDVGFWVELKHDGHEFLYVAPVDHVEVMTTAIRQHLLTIPSIAPLLSTHSSIAHAKFSTPNGTEITEVKAQKQRLRAP